MTDGFGRLHDLDNVWVADGALFASAGGFNPTLTIMALALRAARAVAGEPPLPPQAVVTTPSTGTSVPEAAAAAAVAAGLATRGLLATHPADAAFNGGEDGVVVP